MQHKILLDTSGLYLLWIDPYIQSLVELLQLDYYVVKYCSANKENMIASVKTIKG